MIISYSAAYRTLSVSRSNCIKTQPVMFSNRYQRQIAFEPLGPEGQRRLALGRVLICGCGALGSTVANLLARAGVGFLRILDDDIVQIENLHRQLLFDESNAANRVFKVEAAAQKLRAANSEVVIEPKCVRLTEATAPELVREIDLLIDGSDNFPTRFLLNRTAIRFDIPLITAGVLGAAGQVLTVFPGRAPCLACFLPQEEESEVSETSTDETNNFGILPPVVNLAASLEAIEAIKILGGRPEAVNPRLLTFDLWNNRFSPINVAAATSDAPCPICGFRPHPVDRR